MPIMVVKSVQNEKGLATIELTGFLILFVSMLGFLLGFWGVFHSGVLNSIGARAYAYETFRNRTHLQYFRIDNPEHYGKVGSRFHRVVYNPSRSSSGFTEDFYAPERKLSLNPYFYEKEEPQINLFREEDIYKDIKSKRRYSTQGLNPVWIKVTYGICLHHRCGDR